MFCSKCGKEINDNAAFCDKCGNPTANSSAASTTMERIVEKVYVSKESSAYAVKEKNEKMKTIVATIICCFVVVIFALVAINDIGLYVDGPRIERLEEIISESGSVLVPILILLAIADLGLCLFAYFGRIFEKFFKNIIATSVVNALCPLIIIFAFYKAIEEAGYEKADYKISFFFVFMYAIFLLVEVFRAITFKKASDAEDAARYYENKDSLKGLKCLSKDNEIVTDWKCKHCGSTNKSGQDYCKDCGKYR